MDFFFISFLKHLCALSYLKINNNQFVMILIKKNNMNNIIVTLRHSTTIIDAVYTLLITSSNDITQHVITLTTDVSLNSDRYNQYDMADPTDIDLRVGDYDYFIFESDPITGFNQATDNIIEGGKLRVRDESIVEQVAFDGVNQIISFN